MLIQWKLFCLQPRAPCEILSFLHQGLNLGQHITNTLDIRSHAVEY